MKYRITHQTRYTYSRPVILCHNQAYLLPRDTRTQKCLNTHLQIEPPPTTQSHHEDFFGNRFTYFSIDYPHDTLSVTATSEINLDLEDEEAPPRSDLTWEEARACVLRGDTEELLDAKQYIYESPLISQHRSLIDFTQSIFTPRRLLLEAVHELMQKIYTDFEYDPEFTTISTPLQTVLLHKRGVCQDFAHLAIGCLRSHRLPARYVSGYIETLPLEGGEKLTGADATHAWFSVYAPDIGWVDFDPTNNKIPTNQHIVTAWGRDYSDVSPLKGVIFGGGNNYLDVKVDVQRL